MHPLPRISSLLFGFALACAGPTDDGEKGGDGASDTGGDDDGAAPEVISFSAGGSAITEGEQITFTAVVTDPDGIDDLIGGTLESPQGAAYGAFTSAADEGSYSLVLTWDAIDQVADITFDDEEWRTFIARFYDSGGAADTAEATLRLHCDGEAACAGNCTDLSADVENCGSCGTSCEACYEGACLNWACGTVDRVGTTCDDVCGAGGCYESWQSGASTTAFWYLSSDTCDDDTAHWLDSCQSETDQAKGSLLCVCGS